MSKNLIVPILTIIVGVAWLLNVIGMVPGVDWIWTGALAAAGILSFAVGGLNKLTVVTGPFLIAASLCSVLRQTGRLSIDHEIPVLVIIFGVLLLIAQLCKLPLPEMLQEEEPENGKAGVENK